MVKKGKKVPPLDLCFYMHIYLHEVCTFLSHCAVPENIHTPTTEGIGNSRGVGGSKAQEIPEGRGGWRQNSLPDGRKSIDSLRTSEGATYPLL